MRASDFGAGPFELGDGEGAGDGDGAMLGAALGLGEGLTAIQNVPSLVKKPARPLRSEPGISSDFGGAVRAGAVVACTNGVGAGVGDAIGTTTICGEGATQSRGCTIVSPVFGSNEMMRTPDCAAHASSVSESVGSSLRP